LDEIINKDQSNIEAYFLKGCCLIRLRQFEEAIYALNLTIKMDENHFRAYNYLGNALYESGDFLKASVSYGISISKNINYAEAFYNSALAFSELKQPEAATISLLRALELDSNLPYLLGSCLNNKLNISDWTFLDEGLDYCKQEILIGRKSARPFEALSLFDDEEIQSVPLTLEDLFTYLGLDVDLVMEGTISKISPTSSQICRIWSSFEHVLGKAM
jgi:tetratricopeptide (TPR) repeat protein